MTEQTVFRPLRQRGLFFHGILIVALGATSALSFMLGFNQQVGGYFVLLLLISLLLFAPLPWIIYRAYALGRAVYRVERDGLRLRWGLRAEDVPLPEIEWVRQATDLAADLPLPRLVWPGALLGSVNVPDLGPMEYLASSSKNLILIATAQRIYAISPEDPQTFLRAFQYALEMGSLSPLSSVSVLPAAYLSQVWANKVARVLLVGGFLLNLFLFVGVSLLVPGRATVSLGFQPNGAPLPAVPATQLLLLPILGAFTYVIDFAAGLFFFRHEQNRIIAYITWASAAASAALFIGASIILLLTTR